MGGIRKKDRVAAVAGVLWKLAVDLPMVAAICIGFVFVGDIFLFVDRTYWVAGPFLWEWKFLLVYGFCAGLPISIALILFIFFVCVTVSNWKHGRKRRRQNEN